MHERDLPHVAASGGQGREQRDSEWREREQRDKDCER